MSYICYVYQGDDQVPYMEVLGDLAADAAKARLRQLLRERPHADRAELWDGETIAVRLTQDAHA